MENDRKVCARESELKLSFGDLSYGYMGTALKCGTSFGLIVLGVLRTET